MTITALVTLVIAASPDAGVLWSRPAEIRADHFELLNKRQQGEYTGHVRVLRGTLTMTCDRLIVEYDLNHEMTTLQARGNVEATDKGSWARGDEADYEHKTGRLTVRGNPEARQGKREVRGELVTFVDGSQQVLVTKAKTRVENQLDGGAIDKIAIDSDTLMLDDHQSTAKWSGHVRAERADTTLLAPQMTATYDGQGAITKIEARGGVEATSGTKWARGQRADYDAQRGILVVTGNPEARQGRNHMRGSKFIFYQGTDLLEGENVTSIIEAGKMKKP